MQKSSCRTCGERVRCRDSSASWIFFFIGVVAAFSVRLVAVFMKHNMLYAKAAWYVGVIGFFIFFLYKYNVDTARARLIKKSGLPGKMRRRENLSADDYHLVGEILCSLSSKKDRVNYLIIFSTSVATILFALYEDFLR